MRSLLDDDERELRDAFRRFFSIESTPARVRAAEPLGFDEGLWAKICGLDAVSMALPHVDGATPPATLAALAIVCEEYGRHLAPIPLVEAVVGARVLARTGHINLVPGLVDGTAIATVALRPTEGDHAQLVPAGAVADVVIALDGGALVAVVAPPEDAALLPERLGSTPAATRKLDGDRTVLALGDEAVTAWVTARDEWLLLTAASLAGLATGALELGTRYVSERHQFGRPIGSFQAVAHRLADAATAVEGARLLVRHAATAQQPRDEPAMAFTFAAQTARRTATEALHFHGGYGYMLEYDIHLYLERATAWSLIGGERATLAPIAASLRRDAPIATLGDDPGDAPFRELARRFVHQHVTTDMVDTAHRTGTLHDWTLHRALAEEGWLTAAWPVADGGQERHPSELLVLQDELQRVGAPVDGWTISMSAADAIRVLGTTDLRAEVLPEFAGGRALIALGLSEPDAGSDVASVRTRAVRDGGDWVINGQKMFTTLAHEARWIFVLARTDPAAPKHRGLTVFLVPTSSVGFSLEPVRTLGGERTNITFYDDVRVPDRLRVGDVDGGWRVLTTALNLERGSATGPGPVFVGTLRLMLETALEIVRRRGGGDSLGDPVVAELLARASVDLVVAQALSRHAVAAAATSSQPDVDAAMSKLFTTEAIQRWAPQLLELCASWGILRRGERGAPAGGELEQLFRHSLVTTIYGGSSEVLRGLIARRRLELPDERGA